MKFIAEALGVSQAVIEKLNEKNLIRLAFIKHPFFRDVIEAYKLERKVGEFEPGTLIAKTVEGLRVVRGYPKIKRALTLYPTIKKHFKGEVVLEEKMNGYNVRLVKFGENIYAITRGGFICPYTTEKARRLVNLDFFKDNPKLMLCCEAVGEESPFVPKDVYGVKTIDFYVFDIRDQKTNIALPIKQKEKLAEEYGLKLAPILAEVQVSKAHEIAKEIILELDKRGREGIVIKDPMMRRPPIKYTTSQCNCSDLSYAFRFFEEYGKDFMFSRIIREAFQSFEFRENEEKFKDRCLRLGEAILSMVKSIKEVNEGKRIVEKMRLRFYDLEIFELFKEHIRRMGIRAEFSNPKREEDGYVVWVYRHIMSTTDKIKYILAGNLY
ncbi:MAG TPA: RNA ligase [Archaeoglobus profundus]|nr:RNA ligase [Archaeoglobus profundus]HIP57966.1 RNA ligase [Archaeoglobus profundus]